MFLQIYEPELKPGDTLQTFIASGKAWEFLFYKFALVDESILLFKNEVYPQSLDKYVLCGLVILYMVNWSCKVLTCFLSFRL